MCWEHLLLLAVLQAFQRVVPHLEITKAMNNKNYITNQTFLFTIQNTW